MDNAFWRLAQRFKEDRRLALLLMLPNAAGVLGGYYYYVQAGQFDPASPYFRAYGWWPFISDSPNAVLLASIAILLYAFRRRRWPLLDHFAFLGMVFVGLWTTMMFLLYPERTGSLSWGSTNNVLFVSHMGMPLQALVFVPDLRRDGGTWGLAALVAAWMAFNTWLDYWGPHLHPGAFLHSPGPLPPETSPYDAALHTWSPLLMAAVLLGWLAVVAPGLRARGGAGTPPPATPRPPR
jgi:uncharacterized membrane protein YpjA